MSEDTHSSLYLQICKFAQQFSYDFIDGVTIEIKEFFQRRDEILEFKLLFDLKNHHYKVVSRIKDFTTDIRRFFLHFLQFISYSGATLYTREETDNSIHYLLASVNHKGRGFYCEIYFTHDDVIYEKLITSHTFSFENFSKQMKENREMTGADRNTEDFNGSEDSDVQELPSGWVSAFAFSALHDIPPYVVHDEIKLGHFPAVRGDWKLGQSRVIEALDQEGQRAFYRVYHTDPEFKACPDCPHGWQEG